MDPPIVTPAPCVPQLLTKLNAIKELVEVEPSDLQEILATVRNQPPPGSILSALEPFAPSMLPSRFVAAKAVHAKERLSYILRQSV
jgi:hypothetical protein